MSVYEPITSGNTALAPSHVQAAHIGRRTRPQLRVVALPTPSLTRGQAFVKRALDLCIAIPALIAALPAMAAIAICIRLDSEGPALFRQTRLGLGGRAFNILKFRTMTVLENGPVIRQARENDERITRVGRILRRTSLDELPQLLNVISGEMSIVGPRPHACAHDEYFSLRIENYLLRQCVKPGITGWAQINGHRGETATLDAMRTRVDFDIWYAFHAGFWTDLKIIARTPLEVLRRRNAY